jgi:hypothetical protein
MIAVQEKIKGQNFTSRLLAFCFVHHKHFEINFLLAIAAAVAHDAQLDPGGLMGCEPRSQSDPGQKGISVRLS